MASIPVVGVSGASMGGGIGYTELVTRVADRMAQGSATLAAGQKINASRNSGAALAGSSQALANQTGGNILGFTYE